MVSIYKKDNYRDINSLEDGNCAFNAFSLGFADLAMGNNLDELARENRYNIIIEKLNKTESSITDWTSFKKFLIDNKDNSHLIQKKLALIFREIAIAAKENDVKVNGINPGEIDAFKAEFRDHLYRQFDLPLNEEYQGGDIFKRVPEVIKKYDEEFREIKKRLNTNKLIDLKHLANAHFAIMFKQELSPEQNLCYTYFQHETNEQLDLLDKWFKDTGYQAFLEHQKKDGTWGGDIELAMLGNLFGINVKTIRNESVYEIHNFRGYISQKLLTETQIRVLKDRGVIDRKPNDLWLLELDESVLNTKLSGINNEIIVNFWLENEKKISGGEKCYVPDTWIPSILGFKDEQIGLDYGTFHLLIERGIITKEEKSDRYVFIKMDLRVLMDKMDAVDNKEEFIKLWKKSYQTIPEIYVYNPDSLHFRYQQPKAFTHWNLNKIDNSYAHSNFLNTNLLNSYLLSQNLENNKETGSEGEQSEVQNEISQLDIMHNLLFQLVREDLNETGSLQGEDETNEIFGMSPPSSNSLLVDPAIFSKISHGSTSGDIEDLPYLDSDNEAEVQITSNGYRSFRFFRKLSPGSSRPPSPPHKKFKQETPENIDQDTSENPSENDSQHLKESATSAYNALQAYGNEDNQDVSSHVKDLKTAFNLIIWTDQIPPTYSLQLLLPRTYLSATGANVEFLPPKAVIDFAANNFNQILYAANTHLAERIKSIYLKSSNGGDILNSETISLLNAVFIQLTNYMILTDEVRKKIKSFDISLVLDELKKTNIPKNDIDEIRQFIRYCKLITEQMDMKKCAQVILSYPELNKYGQIKKLFEEIINFDSNYPNTDALTSLVNIDSDEISEKNLAWAISRFIKLFQHDIFYIIENTFKSIKSPSYS